MQTYNPFLFQQDLFFIFFLLFFSRLLTPLLYVLYNPVFFSPTVVFGYLTLAHGGFYAEIDAAEVKARSLLVTKIIKM